MHVEYTVEILQVEEVGGRMTEPKLLKTYHNVEANNLVHARQVGLEIFRQEQPNADWSIVYGKARPS
jgi:hypothetical protein